MIGARHTQQSARGWLLVALRWAAALAVIAALLHFLPLRLLETALEQVPASRFLLILLGYVLAHALGVAKWRLVVNAAGAQLDFATSAQGYAGGLFGTLFLPSIIGGDVVRLAVGLRRSPRPAAVLAGNVVDRFLDMAAQAGLVLLGLVLLPGSLPEPWDATGWRALLIAGGVVVALAGAGFALRRSLLAGRSLRFRRRLARLRQALRAVSKQPGILLLGWLLGTFVQFSFLVLTAQLAFLCGLALPLRVWLFAWPLAKLAALLPLTQGGIGVREAALVALLAPFGAARHLVVAAGLLWEGVVLAGGLLACAVAFALRRAEAPPEPSPLAK
jgi:glycosyltransferase 2 family protein